MRCFDNTICCFLLGIDSQETTRELHRQGRDFRHRSDLHRVTERVPAVWRNPLYFVPNRPRVSVSTTYRTNKTYDRPRLLPVTSLLLSKDADLGQMSLCVALWFYSYARSCIYHTVVKAVFINKCQYEKQYREFNLNQYVNIMLEQKNILLL